MLSDLTKQVLETGLEVEMEEHVGYQKHAVEGCNHATSRNGTRTKTVITEIGPVEVEVPRDRDFSFELATVRKNQRRLDGVDSVRSITFASSPFLRESRDEAEWSAPVGLLENLAARGSLVYRHTRDALVEQVYDAKARRLANVDLATISHRDLASASSLVVNCVHDTMNATMAPGGAIDRSRLITVDCCPLRTSRRYCGSCGAVSSSPSTSTMNRSTTHSN